MKWIENLDLGLRRKIKMWSKPTESPPRCQKCNGTMMGPRYVQSLDILRYTCTVCGFFRDQVPYDRAQDLKFAIFK